MKNKWNVSMLTEAGVLIALSFILDKIAIFRLPQGGSITAGQMIPLIVFSLRHGVGPGLLACGVYGILDMLVGGSIYHPIQAILDYPLAYGLLGLAGLFSEEFLTKKNLGSVIKGTFLGVFGRYVCHVLSGGIFFGAYAPEGQNPWVYSILYNASFLLVEGIITIIIIFLLKGFITKNLSKREY